MGQKMEIIINESKSNQTTFALKRGQCPPVFINNAIIPESASVRYLRIQLDKKLNWKERIVTKWKHIDMITKKLDWLLGRKSHLNLENKILLYKVAIKPIWTYGIELWGCASKTNINIIQRLQSKILRAMANAPWDVSNDSLHNDLGIPITSAVIKERSNKHHNRLETQTNPLMRPLLEGPNFRRLKRRLPIDLK
jgi:hypothetical protein